MRKRANSSSPRATTWIDLQLFRDGDDHDTIGMIDYADSDNIPFSILGGGIRSRAKTTEVSTRMKNKIREHNKKGIYRNQVGVTTNVRVYLSLPMMRLKRSRKMDNIMTIFCSDSRMSFRILFLNFTTQSI